MYDLGIIEHSDSPYSSPIVIVKKPDNTNRFCIDFRAINRVTVFDAEPMPNPDEVFAKLSSKKFISKLDLTKGYWQMPLTESAKPLTAFQTSKGLFQFRVMPFGLVNAAASFSRVMRKLLRGMDNVDNFLDDIVVATETIEEHIQVLKELFSRLRKAKLTAKPSKCFVGYQSINCLGHVVGENRLRPEVAKVEVIRNAKRPETKKQLRSFLGMIGFYNKFIPNFSEKAVPLTDLTKRGLPNKLNWTDSQERAFQSLKLALTVFPILKLPEVNKPFILQTDASNQGIGAVLVQEEEGMKMPVAYASKKLVKGELKLSTVEKECLALIWGIQKFQKYLYGREFVVETDHQPLSYLNTGKLKNAKLMRWALQIQPYRFRVVAIKGKDNVGADYLSRV